MSKQMMALVLALTLGVAGAEAGTTTPAAPTTTTVSLPGTIPASVTRTTSDAVAAFLKAGGQVQLLKADGTVIGTLNADGTVALVSGATLADARTVRVTPAAGQGEAMTYTLARDLSKPGAIKFEVMGPNGKMQALPLSAIVNRQNRQVSTKATNDDQTAEAKEEQQGDDVQKAAKPEKQEKTGEAEHPGKGKGKGK